MDGTKVSVPKVVWAYLVAVLAIGIVVGIAGDQYFSPRRPTNRRPPPSGAKMAERFEERLVEKLKLTPQQREQLKPIVTETSKEMSEAHRESMKRFGQIMDRSHDRIGGILTNDEQRAALAEMKAKHLEHPEKRPPSNWDQPPSNDKAEKKH